MKARILCTLLALSLLLAVPAAAAAEPGVTRLEFVEALAAASGDDLTVHRGEPFSDAAASAALSWAYDKWLVNGDGNGAFRPGDPITRQEAAAILSRYLDYRYTDLPAGCGTGGPDTSDASEWARSAITRCWMYGVIGPGSTGPADSGGVSSAARFRPHDRLSAADAAAWIANAQQVAFSALSATDTPGFADALVAQAAPAAGNWLYSPYSAQLCLAMLAAGARGETKVELLSALQIGDLASFEESVQALLAQYQRFSRIMTLNTANSLWLNQSRFDGGGAFRSSYSGRLSEIYGATVESVTDADSVERINAWANEATAGRIPTVLTEDNREFAAAVVNAVHFKAAWDTPFHASLTKDGSFCNEDGSVSRLAFLHRTSAAGYYATPGVEAVKVDFRNYAADNELGDNYQRFPDADFSMYWIKSQEPLQLEHFLEQATFTNCTVELAVPKFTLEAGGALDDALQALGVETAYDPARADFSAMVDDAALSHGNLYLDAVLQKSYLAIDEEGAEAAAVTVAMAGNTAEPVRPPISRSFTADSPFLFAIRDNATGILLFVGRYAQAD